MSDKIAKAISHSVDRRIKTGTPQVYMGVYNFAEASDGNLSNVSILTETYRLIPKNANVGTLNSGDAIMLIRGPSVPLTILCKVVGNTNVEMTDFS